MSARACQKIKKMHAKKKKKKSFNSFFLASKTLTNKTRHFSIVNSRANHREKRESWQITVWSLLVPKLLCLLLLTEQNRKKNKRRIQNTRQNKSKDAYRVELIEMVNCMIIIQCNTYLILKLPSQYKMILSSYIGVASYWMKKSKDILNLTILNTTRRHKKCN